MRAWFYDCNWNCNLILAVGRNIQIFSKALRYRNEWHADAIKIKVQLVRSTPRISQSYEDSIHSSNWLLTAALLANSVPLYGSAVLRCLSPTDVDVRDAARAQVRRPTMRRVSLQLGYGRGWLVREFGDGICGGKFVSCNIAAVGGGFNRNSVSTSKQILWLVIYPRTQSALEMPRNFHFSI